MIRYSTDEKLEFALVSALQVAEAGRTMKERRIGKSHKISPSILPAIAANKKERIFGLMVG